MKFEVIFCNFWFLLLMVKEFLSYELGTFPAAKSLRKFWNALPMSAIDNQVCTLPDNSQFLGDPLFGDKIFVRDSYLNFINLAFRDFEAGLRGVVLSGNPGYGCCFCELKWPN